MSAGFPTPIPFYQANTYNPLQYGDASQSLTIDTADLRYVRIGSNVVLGNISCTTLTLNGSLLDVGFITGITPGMALASKALVLDSGKTISGITSITSGTYYGTTANIQFMNTDILSAAINVNAPIFYAGATQFIDSSCNLMNINALTMTGTKTIRDVSNIDFNLSSLLYKTIIRKTTAGGAGIELYDTQLSTPTLQPLLNLKAGNTSSVVFTRMCGYGNDNSGSGAYPTAGVPFTISYDDSNSFKSGLRIGPINTSQATNSLANVGLWGLNANLPYFVGSDQFQQALIMPSVTHLTSQITGYGIVMGAKTTFENGCTFRGSGTIMNLKYIGSFSNDRVSYTMDYDTQFEFSLGGSTHPTVPNGFYIYNGGTYRLVITSAGRIGIGLTSPRAPLEISGNLTSITMGAGGSATCYGYVMSSNVWTNYGLGPITATNVAAIFNGNIYNTGTWSASDRRLKEHIKTLDIELEHYNKLNPSVYRYKGDDKFKLGLIAQETLGVFAELVSFTQNENMKPSDDPNDLDGIQLSVDYAQLSAINCSVIKKLISIVDTITTQSVIQSEEISELKKTLEKVDQLEALVNTLITKPALSKWLKDKTP